MFRWLEEGRIVNWVTFEGAGIYILDTTNTLLPLVLRVYQQAVSIEI